MTDYIGIIRMIVQIYVLSSFYYFFYSSLSANKALPMLRSVVVYLFVFAFAEITGLRILSLLMRKMTLPAAVFLCVLYQPELRRSFTGGFATRKNIFGASVKPKDGDIDRILAACERLSQIRRGALIVLPRRMQLKGIVDRGTKINADITTELIVTVFDHDTPLHDGAMVIQNSRIIAAGCYLPLSGKTDIENSFGTRHRAAIGMSEESDAVIVVVSEETGAISLAYGGNLYYRLETPVLRNTLISLLNNVEISARQNRGKTKEEVREAGNEGE